MTRVLISLAFAPALALALGGCVSVGTRFDARGVDKIEKCVTTEADLIKLFGKPEKVGRMSEYKTLSWAYAEADIMGGSESENLTAYVNRKGRVIEFLHNPPALLVNVKDSCE